MIIFYITCLTSLVILILFYSLRHQHIKQYKLYFFVFGFILSLYGIFVLCWLGDSGRYITKKGIITEKQYPIFRSGKIEENTITEKPLKTISEINKEI